MPRPLARRLAELVGRVGGGGGDATGSLTTSMFLGSFAWSFAFISLPFFVEQISTSDPATTLRWTGWIIGVTSLVTVVTGPWWGRRAAAGDPKRHYVLIQLLQGLGFAGMAISRSLFELFVSRVILGFMGAASTLAFVMAGREPDPRKVQRQVAAIQTAMTIGQIVGPLGGAVTAARLGFRASFIVGGVILLGSAAFVHWGVAAAPAPEPHRAMTAARPPRSGDLAVAFSIVLASSTQIFFLASVLPQILPALGVSEASIVEVGGLVVFATAAAAAIGALLTPHLATMWPERRLMAALLVLAAITMAALALPHSLWSFTFVRFLQVLCVAPIFPLVVGRIAQRASGSAIGIINSARIGASFIGPVVATSILASASPGTLYAVLAASGLVCVPLALRRERAPLAAA